MNEAHDELMLDSVGPSAKGGIEIKTHAGGPETSAALLLMADAMMVTLSDNNAENYVEMELRASDKKQYIMTLQRKGHITPHQARVKAEEALKAMEPRTIDSAYDDYGPATLPPLTVVLSGGKPAIRQHDGTWMDYDGSSWDDWEMEYPMTVLHEGQA